ncbi:hypothetical protein PBCV1_A410L [Paramecium bursaria Chlorella virus 1]|uniref:Uncharacterized protein n=1 Tax=Paramecium bursaria Chlorella virus 1 TaxID=10506 RepID=Q98462_PBCV1|nr:hypothetical protein PBCV1_A410L [Paramecium bursaria Chlorella virus 1]AAC96778.1 hypothetical protein [Paramecium bursaria Chlorella virus 1]
MSQKFTDFNTVMRSFISDLSEVFPEDAAIQSSFETFDELVRVNYRKPLNMFVESMIPYAEYVANRDETMFLKMEFPGIDFKKLWFDDTVSANTKNVIWQYISHLLLLAMQ